MSKNDNEIISKEKKSSFPGATKKKMKRDNINTRTQRGHEISEKGEARGLIKSFFCVVLFLFSKCKSGLARKSSGG